MASDAELPTDDAAAWAGTDEAPAPRHWADSVWLRGFGAAGALLALQATAVAATDPADRLDFNWFRALALPLLAGYAAGAIPAILASGTQAIRRLAATLPGGADEAEEEAGHLGDGRRRRWAIALAVGIGVPFVLGGLLTDRVQRALAGVPVEWYFGVAALCFWTLTTHLVLLLHAVGHRLRRLARERVQVDLFHLERLRPFGAFGLQQSLVLLGGLAVAFGLLATPNAEDAFLMRLQVVAGIPLMMLLLAGSFVLAALAFVSPMWAIRRRIQQEKATVLARVGAQLGPHWEETAELERDAKTLGLPGLLALRTQISQLTEWPLDDGIRRRFGLYLLLPVFSLTLKAVIERFIEQLVP